MQKSFIAIFIVSLTFLTFFAFSVSAHPGETDSSGCHVCYEDCDQWGIPWNITHCHDEVVTAENITSNPQPTQLPTPAISLVPSAKPTSMPTIFNSQENILGVTADTPTPAATVASVTQKKSGINPIFILILGGVGYWLYKSIKEAWKNLDELE